MNNIKIKSIYFFLVAIFFTAGVKAQSVAINTDGSVANPSAILDLKSTNQGLLPPRMTQAQRNAISAPAAGLIVYCTNCGTGEPQYYNGTSWVNMVGGTATALTSTVSGGSGSTITFLAHNLGADTTLDPHIPVQGIHGNYYQWGRSTVVANASTPAAAIAGWNTNAAANGAWLDGSKTGTDPCPTGFRVPTKAKWDGVLANNTVSRTGTWTNSATNFAAAIHWGPDASTKLLTLPAAGFRNYDNGALAYRGYYGLYWSSTGNGTNADNLNFSSSIANTTSSGYRTSGFSVRCVSE
jgi:uncharacterized protein (TIGR02145 family)